ncbi:MAG TPA: 7-cyano-7-deazaguanine synthase [Anaerolineae bacterium]|nr:7-cyano-7-deazaguanine synthase [Anaerolineae bacterium]
MRNDILLFSAGLDSYMAWILLDKPDTAYVMIEAPYELAELAAIDRLEQLDRDLNVFRIHGPAVGMYEEADGHIPYRNLLFATTVAAALEPTTIYLGALAGETSRDKSGKFLTNTSALLSYTENRPVRLVAPFRHLTKTQLVRRFLVDHEHLIPILRQTRSCYRPTPGGLGCGCCMACFRRWVAMYHNGIEESYVNPPWIWGESQFTTGNLRYLWQSPVTEWFGIARNNWEAAWAIKASKREREAHDQS